MERFSQFVVDRRKGITAFFAVVLIVSCVLIFHVQINYDLSSYLPEEMNTKQALRIMEEEFSLSGNAQVMVEDISLAEAVQLKEEIAGLDFVKSVTFLDDVYDLNQPLRTMDQTTVESFYRDNCALYTLEFQTDDYDLNTGKALEEIRALVGDRGALIGSAVNAQTMREASGQDVSRLILFIVPVFLLILILCTDSFFEPVLFIGTIGVSVLINMGTNVFLGQISYMTNMCAAVLQFAISMDYSIFLLHRFAEQRALGEDIQTAMKHALQKSFSSIMASCLTTVAGMVALMFMRYRIGLDMGLVLAKGIALSLICVIFLLPALAVFSNKLIEKTHHRSFIPSFQKLGRAVVKSRWVVLPLVCALIIPSYFAQQKSNFLYGETAIASSEGSQSAEDTQRVSEVFGTLNQIVVLVPNEPFAAQVQLCDALADVPHVTSVQGIPTLIDPTMSQSVLPQSVRDQFIGSQHSRIILTLDVPIECAESFQAVEDINAALQDGYPSGGYYTLGSSSSTADIKAVVEEDYILVNWLSIIAVAIILLVTFRSISLPVLLILVIEGSIWINMAIPYFMGNTLIFLGYMIVSSLQLGATIDYAILMTSRYLENRRTMAKRAAAQKAVCDAGVSIFTSALILCSAGLMVGLVSSLSGISELGVLIGRGAALSGIMVLIVLPQLLVLCDGLIRKTTYQANFLSHKNTR